MNPYIFALASPVTVERPGGSLTFTHFTFASIHFDSESSPSLTITKVLGVMDGDTFVPSDDARLKTVTVVEGEALAALGIQAFIQQTAAAVAALS